MSNSPSYYKILISIKNRKFIGSILSNEAQINTNSINMKPVNFSTKERLCHAQPKYIRDVSQY